MCFVYLSLNCHQPILHILIVTDLKPYLERNKLIIPINYQVITQSDLFYAKALRLQKCV